MRRRSFPLLLGLAIALSTGPPLLDAARAATGAPERFVAECPATLAVKERAATPAGGWRTVTAERERIFSHVTVFDGPPQEQASLKPDEEQPDDNTLLGVWRFPGGTRNVWVACYFALAKTAVARPVPNGLRRCVARYRRDGGEWHAERKVVCD